MIKTFSAAFWAEALKARRSRASWLSVIVFCIFPLVGGLFMVILKDPEAAKNWGLISVKSQLVAGAADWPAMFGLLLQTMAIGGLILFAFVTAWVFGREYADHTAKEIMTLPTPRGAIVAAKFVLTAIWMAILALLVFGLGLAVGAAVDIPGWSPALAWSTFGSLMLVAAMSYGLSTFVAFVACAGHGYLPALAWSILVLLTAQIVSVLGWGDWFPWAVPGLLSNAAGAEAAAGLGVHSYVLVALTFIGGVAATLAWWWRADQVR